MTIKIRKRLCRSLSGTFDNLRYVSSYGERYFLASMVCAAGFFSLLFYIMATQPVGLFPPMEPDVTACAQLKSEMPFLSCEPEKIELFYEARSKFARLMRPAKTKEPDGWLFVIAFLLLLAANIFTQLFRQAGYIEAQNKRKLGLLPDPIKQWQKETYGEPGRILNTIEVFYNWTEKSFRQLTTPLMPDEMPEPKAKKILIKQAEYTFLNRLNQAMMTNVSDSSFHVENLAFAVNLSKTGLGNMLDKYLDCTPAEYMTCYRISLAQQLRIAGISVCQVKKSVGYKDDKSFRDNFRERTGVTPSKYPQGSVWKIWQTSHHIKNP